MKKRRLRKKRSGRYSLLQDTIVSVIIVTKNDEDIIKNKLQSINKQLKQLRTNYEILVVDNNSTDGTTAKIRNIHTLMPYTRVLVLSKEYSTEVALSAGLDNCVGDYVKLFNIYTDPPEVIPITVNKLLEGFDIVIGQHSRRVVRRSLPSQIFLNLVARLSQHGFRDPHNFALGLNRKAINSIIRTRRKSRNLDYIHSLIGFKKYVLEFKPSISLRYKLKKESFFELVLVTIDTIISNSFRPMRVLSFAGMCASTVFLMYILGVVILDVFFGTQLAPKGWISVSTVLGTLFFLLFSILALISEYIIRIMNETRNEPFYFVSEEIDKSVILPKRESLNIVSS